VRNTVRVLGAGFACYVIVAACASAQDQTSKRDGGLVDLVRDAMGPKKVEASESGTRLKAKRYVGADGSKQFVNWFDSARNEDCYFSSASDGKTRCLPTGAYALSYFSDATCTTRLAYQGVGCAAPKYAIVPPNPTCSANGGKTIYNINVKHTGMVYVGTSLQTQAPRSTYTLWVQKFLQVRS
jgi:hypothetical protein